MRAWLVALVIVFGLLSGPAWAQDEPLPPELQQVLDTLSPRSGTVEIPEANATLDLGDQYLFYGPDDARTILVDIWGNHPDEALGVLGMVMPAGSNPYSNAWGAVVTYEETGWVSDNDARDADYDQLLDQMREGSAEINAQRRSQGYPGVEIVGWAQSPTYDSVNHSVVWARELDFDDTDINSLNYDLRTLGRSGVLSINLVSAMPELDNIRLAANDFASHASFNDGFRYDDYDASTDDAAGYGIAGLVAGGAGLAVAKKAGLIALLLKFIKPILIGVVVFFGVIVGFFRKLFGLKPKEDAEENWQDYENDSDAEVADAPAAGPEFPEPGEPGRS